jgi:2-hydroxychromene-2-carboxylate isomerase
VIAEQPDLTLDEVVVAMGKAGIVGSRSAVWRFFDRHEMTYKKLNYMWRDIERRARRHSLPYHKPSVYPPNTLVTARIGCLAQKEGWCEAFTKEVFRLHWTEDVIIGTEENIGRALRALGKNVDQIVASAQTDEIKGALRNQTEQAKALSIFGSPSFIVGDELFWGDDRLEDATECFKQASI